MKKGFTIIELLVIISIIGLISSVALANLQSAKDKAQIASAQLLQGNINAVLGAETAAAWNFDGGTIGSPVTTVPDDSGNNISGFIAGGGVATYVQGIDPTGKGVFLNGAHIIGSGISNNANSNVTVTAWLRPSSVANAVNVFSVGSDNCNSFLVGINSSQLLIGNNATVYTLLDTPGSTLAKTVFIKTAHAAMPIQNSKWQFIAVSFNQAGDVQTYLNGDPSDTYAGLPTSQCDTNDRDFRIGGGQGIPGFTSNYTGTIDNVRIYYGSLDQASISKIYAEAVTDRYTASVINH